MIQEVVQNLLCTQYGFCAALCPEAAIMMSPDRWLNVIPVVDEEKCTHCRMCIDVCSGHHFPFSECVSDENATTEHSSEIGSYSSLWSGYSLDNVLRNRASSGGVVSSILSFLLERSMVKGVLVVSSSTHRAFEVNAHLVIKLPMSGRLPDRSTCPSRWTPLSGEVAGGEGPCAVVGLPCHIQAWRKATIKLNRLSRKIDYYIGLFCDHLVDVRFSRLLLRKFGVEPDQVQSIKFRGGGWPGNISVKISRDKEKTIPYDHPLRKFLWKAYLFTPRRCLLC